MSTVDQWTRANHLNRDTTKGGFQLQQTRSEVNDRFREMMGRLRTVFEDGEWFNLLNESENDFTVAKFSDTAVTVTDLTGRDATEKFPLDVCYELIGDTTVFAQVQSIGAYSGGSIQVEFHKITDTDFTVATVPPLASEIVPENLTTVKIYWGRLNREAGFHPTDATTGQNPAHIPAIDDLGDWALKDMGHQDVPADEIDLDLLNGLHASSYQLGKSITQNLVMNGDMKIWQRHTAARAVQAGAGTPEVHADRWIVDAEVAGYQVAKETASVPSGFSAALRLDDVSATPGFTKCGIIQWLTVYESAVIRGQDSTLSYYAKTDDISAGHMQKVRAAIIKMDGAFPVLPTDVVSAWNVAGTLPTLNAGFSYESSSAEVAADEYTLKVTWDRGELSPISASVTENTHLGVFIWCDTRNATAGDSLYITGVQLEENAAVTEFKSRSFAHELRLCQGFYAKTYNPEVITVPNPPVTGVGQIEDTLNRVFAKATTKPIEDWRFPVPMYVPPGLVLLDTNGTPCSPATGVRDKVDSGGVDKNASMFHVASAGGTIFLDQASGGTGDLVAHCLFEIGI